MRPAVKRLDNIDLMCSELEPMRCCYGDVLGPPQWREFQPRGIRDPENNLIHLAQPRAERAEPSEQVVPAGQAA